MSKKNTIGFQTKFSRLTFLFKKINYIVVGLLQLVGIGFILDLVIVQLESSLKVMDDLSKFF